MRINELTATQALRYHNTGNKPMALIEFDGVMELLDYAKEAQKLNGYAATTQGGSSTGHASFSDAYQMGTHGWKEGRDKLAETVAQIGTPDETPSFYNWDVTGDLFDVGAVLAGEPEAWLQPEPDPERRCVNILMNCSGVASVSAEAMKNRGAAVATLVEKLQDHNYSVNLRIMTTLHNCHGIQDGKSLWTTLDIGTTPLDVDTVAFMGHPAFFRCISFAAGEQYAQQQNLSGYGTSVDAPEGSELRKDIDLYLGVQGGWFNFETIAAAQNWLVNTINKITSNHQED